MHLFCHCTSLATLSKAPIQANVVIATKSTRCYSNHGIASMPLNPGTLIVLTIHMSSLCIGNIDSKAEFGALFLYISRTFYQLD